MIDNTKGLLQGPVDGCISLSTLTPEQLSRWESCRAFHRFAGFQQKEILLYRLLFGQPYIQDVLTCVDLQVSLREGLESTWKDRQGRFLNLGYSPVELAEGCFVFHPQNSLVTYLEYNGKYNARFALHCKTKLAPRDRHEGVSYLVERAIFTKNFPGVI